jgi:glycosyltransferase involved in cell wall biosynthesis
LQETAGDICRRIRKRTKNKYSVSCGKKWLPVKYAGQDILRVIRVFNSYFVAMKISVIMPVWNAGDTVLRAIDSLRAQTLQPHEIIVINDGSTDGTRDILHQQMDIKLLDHSHRGIVPALNDGLAAAEGEYIARMDADDICHPQRLELQAAYLDVYKDIGFIGSRVGFGGSREQQAGYATYVDWINEQITPEQITLNRFIESPFAHPSVMFRRELPEQFGAYRDGPFPEDYELWLRWMANGVKAAKIDEELLTWSDPPTRLSRTDTRYSIDAFYETKAEYLAMWLKENNPHSPDVIIWGAGRTTRKRAAILTKFGLRITKYIDLKPRTLDCGTPVIHHNDIPSPEECFIIPMVGNRGARAKIEDFLHQRGFTAGRNCIAAS